MNLSVKEGAGGEHDGARSKAHTELGHGADDAIAFHDQVVTGLREEGQVWLIL